MSNIRVFGAREAQALVNRLDEMVGGDSAGWETILGAIQQRHGGLQGGGSPFAARAAAAHPMLRSTPVSQETIVPLTFPLTSVPAAGANSTATAYQYFQPRKLVMYETVSPTVYNSSLTAVNIGNLIQSPSGTINLPTLIYGYAAVGNNIHWATVQPAIPVIVTVSTLAATSWGATVTGPMVQ